jgi:hypothetical protein
MADMELVLDGVKRKLETELDATTATVNGEHTDFDIDRVPDTSITISTRAEIPYPSIMVLPERARPDGANADMGAMILSDDFVRVVIWISEANEDVLARRLIRELKAVKLAVLKGRKIEGGYGVFWQEDDYGPVFRPEPAGNFISSAAVVFKVKQNSQF